MIYLLRTARGYRLDYGNPLELYEAYRVRQEAPHHYCVHHMLEDELCWYCDAVREDVCNELTNITGVEWCAVEQQPDEPWFVQSVWRSPHAVCVGAVNGRALVWRDLATVVNTRMDYTPVQTYKEKLQQRIGKAMETNALASR